MAHTQIDQQVVARFFEALDELKARRIIRGAQTFCNAYDIDKRNFYKQRKQPQIQIMHFDWLQPMVLEYGVSSLWLLTGLGKMFVPGFGEPQNTKNNA
jgi:hypothetical protein